MSISRPLGLSAAGLALVALMFLFTSQFARADDEIVLLEDDGFSQQAVTVSEGDSVTWNNDTEFVCTVTFPGGTPAGSYAFPFSLQFDEAGIYEYQCAVVGAATFTGTVTVEEVEDEETPTPTMTSTPATSTATPSPTNTPATTATATNTPVVTPTTVPATATPTTAAPTTAPSSPTVVPTPIPPATGTGSGPGGSAMATLLIAALALAGGGVATVAGAKATRRRS